VLETGRACRQTVQLVTGDTRRRYDLYLEPVRDEKGNVTGVSGVATDITTLA
jgi:PAS domain-containing protein